MNHFYQHIQGHCTFASFYEWLVKQLPNQPSLGVEVGVLNGQSAAMLGVEIENSGKPCLLDLVDICDPEQYLGNLIPVSHIIHKAYQMTSLEAAALHKDSSLDFVFIDTDHQYKSTKAEIKAWLPRVKPGGIVAGHDFCNQHPGVIKAVIESFDRFNVMRCEHWQDAPPDQKDLYWAVWYHRKEI